MPSLAAEPSEAPSPRQIYVPFSDLHVLLEQQPKRVLLGREEYDELVKKAKKSPETHAPQPAAIVAAQYTVAVSPQRAAIQGTLTVDVLDSGLHALPLDLGGVGLRGAKLDGRNAAIGQDTAAGGRFVLFVEGVGRHELSLDLVAPLETTAARQVLNFRLPHPAASQLRLTVPGDVEIKEGADVISRVVDAGAKLTRFELLPRQGDMSVVMTLNSHLQRQQRAVMARSVLIDEVTQAYEKLHATVSLAILYRAVDRFQFVVPDGFEITEVNSPLLARWDVQPDGKRQVLNVRLREQTTETVVLNVAAVRSGSPLSQAPIANVPATSPHPNPLPEGEGTKRWHAPRLEPLDVVGNVTVFGLLVEDRLKVESLAAEGLIPIDTSALSQALPAVLLEGATGAPSLRIVAAWYAPQNQFSVTANYRKPPAEMAVTTSLLLVLADKGQEVLGGLSLQPRVEKRFAFDLAVPLGWQIASVTTTNGRPLQFERTGTGAGVLSTAERVHVRVPGGISVGREFKVNFRAVLTSTDWLSDWTSRKIDLPRFFVLDATHDEGAVAVDVRDDMTVRPEKVANLTPLDAAEKPKYGLADVSTVLAYRYEASFYVATLAVERTKPRLSARTFSFLRTEPDALTCHYELIYTIEEARAQRLALLLPKETPASISIAALDGVKLKEFGSEPAGESRRWNVLLAEPHRGRVRLTVDFQQPLPSQEPRGFALPLVRAEGVAYQSGLTAVEGCAELDVRVDTSARRVDVGELAEADYQPGRRLLGAFGFAGDPPAVKVDVLRHPGYGICPTIVERCELDTNLSPEGASQTQAQFRLRTKAVYLQVQLPADARLWSAELDGTPLKPQRQNDSVLVDVPAGASGEPQTLQIVYAAPADPVVLRGTVDVLAAKLLLRGQAGQPPTEVPLANLVWRLRVPNGYQVVRTGGTVASDPIERPTPAAAEVAGISYYLTGGFGWGLLRPLQPVQVACHAPVCERTAAPPSAIGLPCPTRRAAGGEGSGPALLSPQAPLPTTIGRISGMVDCQWEDSGFRVQGSGTSNQQSAITNQKRQVQLGDRFALKSGLLEVTYGNGTKVILQGPVTYEVESPSSGFLAIGHVMVQPPQPVPPGGAFEFRIRTPKGEFPITTPHAVTVDANGTPTLASLNVLKSNAAFARTVPGKPAAGSESATKDQEHFEATMESVDKSSIPFPDSDKKSEFADAKEWETLNKARHSGKNQSLAGMRSLKIDVVQTPPDMEDVLTFRSLGVEPRLSVTLVDRSRLSALGWGLGLAVALVGAAITRRRTRTKALYVLAVGIAATLLPLVLDSVEVAEVCNMAFFGAAWLVPYYLLAGAVRWLLGVCCRGRSCCATKLGPAATAVTVMVSIAWCSCIAGSAAAAEADAGKGPYVIQVVDPTPPVQVPNDAILLPYDPEWKNGIKDADKLLLPYDKYVELWNRAYPDKKIDVKKPPAPYALAGAEYKATLDGDEYLLATGQIEIDVFSDKFVQVPLRLAGGVLAQAELDGKPARLSVAAVEANADNPFGGDEAKPQGGMVVLHVSGKGRHKLALSVRLKLARQGGWRTADGVLPAAPATALSITVPKPQTELRLGKVADRRTYETEKPDESIPTALSVGGAISIQWRPKLAEGQVDRSLTAASSALFDVREDGLRLTWRLNLEFRHGQRERFEVALPADYLLEKVEGNNVRGWELRKGDKGPTVEITMLQAAKDRERFTLRLRRAGAVGQKDLAEFAVPLVAVPDAVLHNGQLTIRRSPLLELRTVDRSGATRTDLPADGGLSLGEVLGKALGASKGSPASPLGIRPFEAYSFAAVPFAVRIAAAPVAVKMTASVQTVLRIAQFDRNLESRITFDVQDRPVYQLRVRLPNDLQLDSVSAPGEFQYAVTQEPNALTIEQIGEVRRLARVGNAALGVATGRVALTPGHAVLTIYLATGQQGNVPVILRGKLGGEGELKDLSLPRLEVLDVERQQGDVAVQVDPGFDVDASELKNCDRVLLGQLHAWLTPEQQRVTRLGLHYTHGDYGAKLRLTPRLADVVCDTITNVRVTDRAIEETILLDFTIRNAGVREVAFLLPAEMAGCRISAPMLRQKTIEPVGKKPGDPLRVRIELQDEVMDQLRILVENDRLLTPGVHEAPIPTVELGRTNRRYVAIESAGRDSVKIDADKLRELDALGRQQKEWETLGGILGREMTLAYLVAPDARQPRLAYHAEQRAAVETVGAGIGLAETTLVFDANGAYRAQQVLRIDNSTEQFLEIQLPEGARLWTAYVAGEPVKPTVKRGTAKGEAEADPVDVRIPLIKTAPGELHYEVVLKYGGQMRPLGIFDQVDFPLIRCRNIRPELSQVRLYLPERYRWFDFGGTMRRVEAEADLQAGYISFQTSQLKQLGLALREGDKWTKMRAAANLKTQQRQLDEYRSAIPSNPSNAQLQSELNFNANVARQTREEAAQVEQTPAQSAQALDNRQQLNARFQGQKAARAKNVVNDIGTNWKGSAEPKPAKAKLNLKDSSVGFSAGGTYSGDLDIVDVQAGGEGASGRRDTEKKPEISQSPSDSNAVYGTTSLGASTIRSRQSLGRSYNHAPQQQAAQPQQPSAAPVGQPTVVDGKTFRFSGSQSTTTDATREGFQQAKQDLFTPPQKVVTANQPGGQERLNEERYKERLERQSVQQAPLLKFGVGVNSDSRLVGSGETSGQRQQAFARSIPRREAVPTPPPSESPATVDEGVAASDEPSAAPAAVNLPTAAGLASLDFELPTQGELYRFTIPRGEATISARAITGDLLRRGIAIVAVLVVAVAAWFVVRRVRPAHFAWLATQSGSTLLICLGLLAFLAGLLPWVGLLAILIGGILKVHRWCGESEAKRPA